MKAEFDRSYRAVIDGAVLYRMVRDAVNARLLVAQRHHGIAVRRACRLPPAWPALQSCEGIVCQRRSGATQNSI